MAKLGKVLAGILGALLLLTAGLVIYVTQVLDPNAYRGDIERIASQKGLELKLQGPIHWTWYPRLGLQIEDAVVGSEVEPLLSIKRLSTHVSISPLFRGRVVVEGVHIEQANVRFYKSVQDDHGLSALKTTGGAEAFDDVAGSSDQSPDSHKGGPSALPKAGVNHLSPTESSGGVDLAVEQLRLSDVTVQYRDEVGELSSDVTFSACDLSHFDLLGNPFDVRCQATIAVNDSPTLAVAIDGQLSFSRDSQQLNIKALSTELTMASPSVLPPSETIEARVSGQVMLGSGEAELLLELEPVDVRRWLAAMNMPLPLMASEQALSRLGVTTEISVTPKEWQAKLVDFSLDKSQVSGEVSGHVDAKGQQAFSVALTVDALNVDDYLAPEASPHQTTPSSAKGDSPKGTHKPVMKRHGEVSSVEASSPESRRLPSEPFDLSPLREIVADVSVSVDRLLVADMTLSDVTFDAGADRGLLTVNHLNSQLYGGEMAVSGTLDARQAKARMALHTQLSSVAVEPLLIALAGESRLSGRASVNLSLNAVGSSLRQWQQRATGSLDVNAEALKVKELDIERQFCELSALLNRKPVPAIDWLGQTQLQDVVAKITVKGESLEVQTLQAGVEELQLNATGSSHYIQGDFDLAGGLTVTGEANPDRACQIRDRWRNKELPLRCRGNMDQPLSGKVCAPDSRRIDALLTEEAKGRLEKKLQDKLKSKLSDDDAQQVEQLLRGIFGR